VIDRRTFTHAFAGGLVIAPFAAGAQQAAKIARIGYLSPNLATINPRLFEGFRQGMRELGYVEGRNLLIEFRSADGKPERLPAVAAELVALKVDVIVTAAGTLAALAAKQATQTIPVVFVAVGEPVASGLVGSLARPGSNVTGLSLLFPELVSKSLELLKQAVPGVSRVAFLWQTGSLPENGAKDLLKGMDAAAAALGVRLQVVQVRGPEDFDRAFSDMARERAEALDVPSTPVFSSGRKRLAELAAQNRIPTVFTFREYVDAGGLMSYGPDLGA
jgi:putative ABC transport system substrate-binding protein